MVRGQSKQNPPVTHACSLQRNEPHGPCFIRRQCTYYFFFSYLLWVCPVMLQDVFNIKNQIEDSVGFEALNKQIQVQTRSRQIQI